MTERERLVRNSALEELTERIGRAITHDGVFEPFPDLRLARASGPTERLQAVARPSLCVIAQGAKEVYVGDRSYRYDSERYLLATIEMPLSGRVVEATPYRPYLALRVDLDPALVGSVMLEAELSETTSASGAKAIAVSTLDAGLLDACLRLIRMLESPQEARFMMPMVRREIVYRLLMGSQGPRLRHLSAMGGHTDRIAQAVEKLRSEFDRPLRIENLAKELGMSSSGFHHHFKAVTDMSPLQFQKQIRLQEARRLMLGNSLDAATAGFKVGYDDASHFSRDYKKLFGHSPIRDVERLRAMAIAD